VWNVPGERKFRIRCHGFRGRGVSEERFPNDQLLVTTDWVADHLDDPDVRIVEVTPPGSG